MRDWLGKPLLILAGIMVVLGGASLFYMRHSASNDRSQPSGGSQAPSGGPQTPSAAFGVPSAFGASAQAGGSGMSVHQRQIDQACRLMDDR